MTDHAKELIEKHANEYLDAEEAARKREKEGLESAVDKHTELQRKVQERKKSPRKTDSEFDSVDTYTETPTEGDEVVTAGEGEEEVNNPVAEPSDDT